MENTDFSKKLPKVLGIILKVLFYIFIALLLILFGTISYLRNTWKELTYQEIVFHLKTSIAGTSPEMVISGLLRYGLPVLVFFIALVVALKIIAKKNIKLKRIVALVLVIVLLVANGINLYLFNKGTNVITDFIGSITRDENDDFVRDVYVDPSTVTMTFPEQKRNLIYIYLESMETTYSDTSNGGGLFIRQLYTKPNCT